VATLVTYPTQAHERAAAVITELFAARDETDAVLLTNSCARGKATPDSCLDMQVVVQPHAVASMEHEFGRFASRSVELAELHRAGRFSDLHLDVSDGVVTLAPITEEAISWSEVVVGTFFVYSVPLHVNGARQGFLLGLHVARRTYPISYDKWIREQVAGNLGLPEVYHRLPRLFELERFESRALEQKATALAALVDEYVRE
jgi:hypothetical protein